MTLSDFIAGLPTCWPESITSDGGFASDGSQFLFPKVDELDISQQALGLSVCYATHMYKVCMEECRPEMRRRREDDPNTIDTASSGGSKKYPKAINSDTITLGVIGCGQVGRAVVGTMLRSGLVQAEDVVVSTRQPGQLNQATSLGGEWYKVCAGFNNVACAEHADVLVVCVPPAAIQAVAKDIAKSIRPTSFVVAVCLGMQAAKIKNIFETETATRLRISGPLVATHATKSDALDRDVDPIIAQTILERQLAEHHDEVDQMLEAVGSAVHAHNYGFWHADDAKAAGQSKEEQEECAVQACNDLVRRTFENLPHSLKGFLERVNTHTVPASAPRSQAPADGSVASPAPAMSALDLVDGEWMPPHMAEAGIERPY